MPDLWTTEFLVVAGLVFVFAGFIKGVIGVGMPTIAMALLAATLDLKAGLALILVPAFATNVWQAFSGGAFWASVKRLSGFLVGTCIGLWLGVGVLKGADAKVMSGLLGLILCAYAAVSLATPQIPPPGRHERWLSPPLGALSGFVAGSMGSFVMPGALYLPALGLPRDVFVQAMGVAFITATVALAVALGAHAMLPRELGALSVAALMPALIGMALGQHVRRRIPEARFRRLFFAGLLALGAYMAARAFVL